jgi:hypothetical protein
VADQDVRYELLRPYFFWGTQNEPGIYFFISQVAFADGSGTCLEVDYIGQAEIVSRRVRFGSHHRLRDGYRPNRVLYMPLLGAGEDDLIAAENLFILLYRPVQNRKHMPRVGYGDLTRWARRLVNCMNRRQHEALYRFLVRRIPEYPDLGQPVADEISRALGAYLSEDDQIVILRDIIPVTD